LANGKTKRDWTRYPLEDLETWIKDRLLETEKNNKFKFHKVGWALNVEPALLMLLVSPKLWKTVRLIYKENTESGLYKTWTRYKDERIYKNEFQDE